MTAMINQMSKVQTALRCSVNINCLFAYLLFFVSFYIIFDILELCGFFFLFKSKLFQM